MSNSIEYHRLSAVFNALRPKGVNTAPLLFFSEKGTIFGAAKLPRPLDIAIRNRDIKEVEALLDKGAKPNLNTHFSGPAIKEAAKIGDIDMVKLLHARGGDVNGTDTAGGTALHAAISEMYDFNKAEKLAVIEYLLQNGARTDMKNSCDATPLEWARQLCKGEAETLIAKHMGISTVDEIAAAKQADGSYIFAVTAGRPGRSTVAVDGLRHIHTYSNNGAAEAKYLLHDALDIADKTFGLGACEAFIRDKTTGQTASHVKLGGDYELVLVPEQVIKARAKAAADEKAAFADKLDKGLPTDGKVTGMKPISYKKPAG